VRPALTFAAALAAALVAAACSSQGPSAETPEGALSLFLETSSPLSREFDRERAFKLLAPEVRRELQRRAAQASKQGGRRFAPSDMLVVERVTPRWQIKRMETRDEGDRAVVTVHGAEPSQTAEVELRREGDGWTVVLPL
jgi:hypothetical protein